MIVEFSNLMDKFAKPKKAKFETDSFELVGHAIYISVESIIDGQPGKMIVPIALSSASGIWHVEGQRHEGFNHVEIKDKAIKMPKKEAKRK